MGTLQHRMSGTTLFLHSHHTFGRHEASVNTHVESGDVSQIHASIRWEGAHWRISDLSRNGTWVGDRHLTYGQSTHLFEGGTIRFGGSEKSVWTVIDLSAPKTVLVPLNNSESSSVIELNTFYGLPDDDNPEISLYIAENGQWLCEQGEGVRALSDGDVISQGQMLWAFHCAGAINLTSDIGMAPSLTSHEMMFQFNVSLDEEHVLAKLIWGHESLELGERVHHYLLLTLARRRLEDRQNGVDASDAGWIDLEELGQLLGLEPSYINIQIFRARQQVAKLLSDFPYLPQIVERRVGSVRFGCSVFTIIRGSEVAKCGVEDTTLWAAP